MGIDQLKDIYNPLAKRVEPQDVVPTQGGAYPISCVRPGPDRQPLNSWHDSAPIMRLSAYLKENKEHGITIIIRGRGSVPSIHFNPGLCRKDMDVRWQIAHETERLFWDAFEDMSGLMKMGKLKLPELSDHVEVSS